MFTKMQWIGLLSVPVVGAAVITLVSAALAPAPGYAGVTGVFAGNLGMFLPALFGGIIGGCIGRRKGQSGATTGVIVGYVVCLTLLAIGLFGGDA